MPAARYWRAIGLQTHEADEALELSAFHLYLGGTRVDATATLASTIEPSSGTLGSLQDDNTATVCRWLDVSAPGFALVWDFGAGKTADVSSIRLGSGAINSEFLERAVIQYYSDAANWTTLESPVGLVWPGPNALQDLPEGGDPNFGKTILLMPFEGANNSTTFTDKSLSAKAVTVHGGAKISTAEKPYGTSSGYFPGTGADYAKVGTSVDFAFGTGDFTIEARIFIPTGISGGYAAICDIRSQASGAGGVLFKLNSARNLGYYYAGEISTSSAVPLGAWTHVAICRASGVTRLFIAGTKGAEVADTDVKVTNHCYIGRVYDNANPAFSGYIKDLRIKNEALYTADFTPPSAPLPQTGAGSLIGPSPLRTSVSSSPIQLSGGISGPAAPVIYGSAIAHDVQDFGPYRIYGTVELKGTPNLLLRRRVQLYNQRDNRLIRETWSDATTGVYTFNNIKGGPGVLYFVCTFDHTSQHRAVIADQIVPEDM
ncbi:LamG domain-containing protein [Giesbergeria anulus]|uniref:Concanavalin A-like lectin/glucanases superfamily protein n=1 Tax=Giesbergeria anulus TaxID=180197 RepID=A0A1H9JBG3_9BURK|nr:LamG domain-containing protein [Giesbergeria anulus]SEQ84351.1 Concanavalin A-like lectin/glucanases superfamily protein [Giesbergeria anulus]